MISYKKINRGQFNVTSPSTFLDCYITDDGYHHVKYSDKENVPIVSNDGGMTPHTLRANPSLMVTGTQFDCTPIEKMEENLSSLEQEIVKFDVESNNN